MNCIGTEGITVLDFYLSLTSRESPEDCRGPIVYLNMVNPVVSRLMAACKAIDQEGLVLNSLITPLDEGRTKLGSCMAHWMDISSITSVVGAKMNRNDFQLIARGLLQNICNQLDWDFKELDNYIRSRDLI